MFPNWRLLTGALLASIFVLCCGFGVFAAFGVNHEPLGRLPANTMALQLVVDEPTRPPQTWGVPIRPQAGDAQIGTADLSMPAPAPVRSAAIELASPATPPPLRIDRVNAWTHERASQPATSSAPAAAAAVKPSHAAPPAAPASSPAPIPGAAVAATLFTAPAGAVKDDAPGRSPQTPQMALASTATSEPATKETLSAPSAARPTTGGHHAGKLKPRRKIARKPLERHRVVAKRRVIRKTAAATTAQFGEQQNHFQDPVFRSAAILQQQPQARTRAAEKPAKDDAPVNPFAWSDAH